jgi:gliding motility-associated-like protein
VIFNPVPDPLATHAYYTCLDEAPHYVVIDAGNPGSSFDWSTSATSQVILAGAYGWYFVNVTNRLDCTSRDSAQVIEYCPPSIYVPNTFTPNGDGINDLWMPVGKSIASMELTVFDRYGRVLFESDQVGGSWDGTAGGELVKSEVYVWKLRYRFFIDEEGQIGEEHEQLGHVTVLY